MNRHKLHICKYSFCIYFVVENTQNLAKEKIILFCDWDLQTTSIKVEYNSDRTQDSSAKREVVEDRKDLKTPSRILFCQQKWEAIKRKKAVQAVGTIIPWERRNGPLGHPNSGIASLWDDEAPPRYQALDAKISSADRVGSPAHGGLQGPERSNSVIQQRGSASHSGRHICMHKLHSLSITFLWDQGGYSWVILCYLPSVFLLGKQSSRP